MQFGLVVIGYAGVLLFAAASLYGRHLLALQDPAAASGGMAAFGDTLLYLFLGCLFLIPTAFLIWTIAKSEALYTTYSRFLFGLSLSAPICLGLLSLGEKYVALSLSWLCLFRILESPIVLVGMGMSRFAARFDRSKRFVSYALLVEGLTLGLAVAGFAFSIFI
jgi:hypothetical protein